MAEWRRFGKHDMGFTVGYNDLQHLWRRVTVTYFAKQGQHTDYHTKFSISPRMPEGSIDDHLEACRPLSRDECKQILAQTSDILTPHTRSAPRRRTTFSFFCY